MSTTKKNTSTPIRTLETLKLRSYLESQGRDPDAFDGVTIRDAKLLGHKPVIEGATLDEIGVTLDDVPDEFFISKKEAASMLAHRLPLPECCAELTLPELESPNVAAFNAVAGEHYDTFYALEYNRRYALVDNAGDVRIYDRVTKTAYTLERFKLLTRNARFKAIVPTRNGNRIVEISLGENWLGAACRLKYDGLGMFPKDRDGTGRDYRDNPQTARHFNTWSGFATEPKQGDWSLMHDHLLNVTCGGNQEHFDYLMGWMAHMLQRPWEKPGVAVITWSPENRTGKGTVTDALIEMIGDAHATMVMRRDQATGKFAETGRMILQVNEETAFSGDHETVDVLKAMISERRTTVERKGVDKYETASYTRYWFNSNRASVIKAIAGDDRFFVLKLSPEKAGDKNYFRALRDEMRSGGVAAFMHYLVNLDLSNFDVRSAPMTEHFGELVLEHLPPLAQGVVTMMCAGAINHRDHEGNVVDSETLNADAPTWVDADLVYRHFGPLLKPARGVAVVSPRKIASELRKLGVIDEHRGTDARRGQRAEYRFVALDELRTALAAQWGVQADSLGAGSASERRLSEDWLGELHELDALLARGETGSVQHAGLRECVDKLRRAVQALRASEAGSQGHASNVLPMRSA